MMVLIINDNEETLKKIITDIQWMAKRYVDGRLTYAPSMYNEAIRKAMQLGIEVKPDPMDGHIFARDSWASCCDVSPEDIKVEQELCRKFGVEWKEAE